MFVLITTYVVYSAWRHQGKGPLLEIAHLRRQKGQEKNLKLKIEMIKEYESGTFKQTELASKCRLARKKYGVRYSEIKRRVEKGMGKWGKSKTWFTYACKYSDVNELTFEWKTFYSICL